MRVISFVNPKGGTGKSTSALILACEWGREGLKVGVLDTDPNQTIYTWDNERSAQGHKPLFKVYPKPPENEIVDVIDSLDTELDILLIDVEGSANLTISRALARTDLAIIPLKPKGIEARQAGRAIQLIEQEGRAMRHRINYTLLFTCANAAIKTRAEQRLRATIQERQLKIMDVALVERAAYDAITELSLSLEELDPKQNSQLEKARDNARRYARCVADLVENLEND